MTPDRSSFATPLWDTACNSDVEDGLRLLVVEDERSMAATLQRGLEAEGYTVDVASDGEEGLWRAMEGEYDAVVLDLMLPKLNGYKVCDQLRRAGNNVPVLMLTAKQGEFDQTEALDTGADDFLSKPFSYPVLLARLRALIRRGAASHGAILRQMDLVLDTATHRLWRGNEEVELTAREFSVLSYLMHHPGQIVTKSELLQHIWDNPEDTDSNVVEVYIGYLRRKLDGGRPRSIIQTLRGVGYRMDVESARD
jgi:two-component system, OmpR family, response regulator